MCTTLRYNLAVIANQTVCDRSSSQVGHVESRQPWDGTSKRFVRPDLSKSSQIIWKKTKNPSQFGESPAVISSWVKVGYKIDIDFSQSHNNARDSVMMDWWHFLPLEQLHKPDLWHFMTGSSCEETLVNIYVVVSTQLKKY